MRSKIQEYKKIIVPIILSHLPKVKIILYGSRARGDWGEGSDIDIALDMGAKIDSALLTAIINDIEESVLPIKFDIVDFHNVSDEMHKEILKSGIMWQKVNQKLAMMHKTLDTLHAGIELLHKYKKTMAEKHIKQDEVALAFRDSIIQRFEYCTDLFWKVLKIYLEDVEKVTLSAHSPMGVIRAAIEARIITEDQGQQCLEMVKSRNLTSHIYHEEVAHDMAAKIPHYYQLMKLIIDGVQERSPQKS